MQPQHALLFSAHMPFMMSRLRVRVCCRFAMRYRHFNVIAAMPMRVMLD